MGMGFHNLGGLWRTWTVIIENKSLNVTIKACGIKKHVFITG